MTAAIIGGILTVTSGVLLYLASPNQQWGALPFPSRALGWSGVLALVAGTALMLQWAGPATAIFITFTLAMTVWSIVPLAVAWLRHTPESRK